MVDHPAAYLTNDAGDIWAEELPDGSRREVDPSVWGWHGAQAEDPAEDRRTLGAVRSLPGFSVEVTAGSRFIPGPRPDRSKEWVDGAAPPTHAESRDGVGGTRAYLDRLSDGLGRSVKALTSRPDRSPFLVHDHVGGRVLRVSFAPPPPGPGGDGKVYLVSDGLGIKIGFTTSSVASRIAGLQTGNPRLIEPLATVNGVTDAVESASTRPSASIK